MITYKPFWHYCIDKGITKTYLNEEVGLTWPIISKLVKDQPVRFDTIEKICMHFNISIEQVVSITSS